MKNIFKTTPMPIVGVMLAFATLGNLMQSYSETLRTIFGCISAFLFVCTTIKFLTNFKDLSKELSTPIGASVFPTYSMGIIILATYIKPLHANVAYFVWIFGIILHLFLMMQFTYRFIKNFKIKQVFPSWFIVYVGIAVTSVTGKAFNQTIGQLAFWFAFITYLILLFVVSKRIFIVKEIPEPALPTLIIYSAPGSLCLAGYLNAFDNKNIILFWFLLILSQLIYAMTIIKLTGLLKLKFYPSYAAFTFPLVISAFALKLSNSFLTNQNLRNGFVKGLVKFEEGIAFAIVFYVFIRYFVHILQSNDQDLVNPKNKLVSKNEHT